MDGQEIPAQTSLIETKTWHRFSMKRMCSVGTCPIPAQRLDGTSLECRSGGVRSLNMAVWSDYLLICSVLMLQGGSASMVKLSSVDQDSAH